MGSLEPITLKLKLYMDINLQIGIDVLKIPSVGNSHCYFISETF